MSTRRARPGPAEAGHGLAGTAVADAGTAGPEPAGWSAPGTGRADGPGTGRAGVGEPGPLPPLVNAWRSLAARHAAVTTALEHELGVRHGLGVSEFEVLERLAENDQHKFRVQELAESVHLSQSTLSRLIGRLEQHGLVQRNMCDADRRGIDVCLTDAGRQRHAEAVPTHRAVLAATLSF
jgi:DNA-binding MarR family transcriptional regulator